MATENIWVSNARAQALTAMTAPQNVIGVPNGDYGGLINTSESSSDWVFLMGDPTAAITGTQTIRVYCKAGENTNNPTMDLFLNEGDFSSWTQKATLYLGAAAPAKNNTLTPYTQGWYIEATWDASLISNRNNVVMTGAIYGQGGSPSNRNSIAVEGILWIANTVDPGAGPVAKVRNATNNGWLTGVPKVRNATNDGWLTGAPTIL